MDFDAENNSIFEGLNNGGMSLPQNVPMPEMPQQQNLLGSFINNIKNKLDEVKHQKSIEQLEITLNNFVDENTETLLILKSFGCKLTIKSPEIIEISSEEFKISGYMYIKNNSVDMDEDAEKLFNIISQIISGGYRIEDILNKYEKEEFYPIGEIEQVPIIYKGTEITASRGRLANPKGEIKTILFYKGYEILPDDELEKE